MITALGYLGMGINFEGGILSKIQQNQVFLKSKCLSLKIQFANITYTQPLILTPIPRYMLIRLQSDIHRCATAIFAHGRTFIIIANSSVDNLRLS